MPNALTVDETNPETAVRQANPPLSMIQSQWVIHCVSPSPCVNMSKTVSSATDSIVDEEFLAHMTDLLSSKNNGHIVQEVLCGPFGGGLILSHD